MQMYFFTAIVIEFYSLGSCFFKLENHDIFFKLIFGVGENKFKSVWGIQSYNISKSEHIKAKK